MIYFILLFLLHVELFPETSFLVSSPFSYVNMNKSFSEIVCEELALFSTGRLTDGIFEEVLSRSVTGIGF